MPKFRHKLYKGVRVLTDKGDVQFEDYEAEVEDKDLVKVLKGNPDVEEIKEKKGSEEG